MLPNHQRYLLTSSNDLSRLAVDLDELVRRDEQFLTRRKAIQQTQRAAMPLPEMSSAQLRNYYSEPLESPTANELRGLRKLRSLGLQLAAESSPAACTNTMKLMAETARSLENLHRPPIPTQMEVAFMPLILVEYLHRPVGRGTSLAANIDLPSGGDDASRSDPPDSTFWKRPASIAQADLFHGFSRSALLNYPEVLWEYDEPKTSFGTNPGFKLKHGKEELKAKFGEFHSEPFAARVFHALGYNAEPTDYAASLKVKYDRRLFREFNQRKQMELRFHLLGVIPGGRVVVQKYHDPFQFIAEAVLKDGTRMAGPEFKTRLLRDSARERPEDDPENFDVVFEAKVDHLVTSPANVQVRETAVQNLGPWDFGGLGHEDLRELRGVGLLAAWLGWVDVRFDNTRLKLVDTGGGPVVAHYFSDLGGGMGKGVGYFSWHPEEINEFDWTFTKPLRPQGKGRMTIPFRIANYRPVDPVPAFREMTLDDARWMGRMIGQLTEGQIVQGLIASRWDSASVRLLTEKLVSRRDQMINDLGLADEIPLLRPEGVCRNLSYDPTLDGPMVTTLTEGQKVSAPASRQKVVSGKLVGALNRR